MKLLIIGGTRFLGRLWLPEAAAPHLNGFMFINCDKAVAAGLNFRPLATTIDATLTWYQSSQHELEAGLAADKEATLLGSLQSARNEPDDQRQPETKGTKYQKVLPGSRIFDLTCAYLSR